MIGSCIFPNPLNSSRDPKPCYNAGRPTFGSNGIEYNESGIRCLISVDPDTVPSGSVKFADDHGPSYSS